MSKPRQQNPDILYLHPAQFYAADLAGFIVRDPDGSLWFEGWTPHSRVIIMGKVQAYGI